VIPEFTAQGNLPEGIHPATWKEFTTRLGFNEPRRKLLRGFSEAWTLLRAAGCRRLYVGGSFASDKARPKDIDGCWDSDGVNVDALDPIFFDFEDGRAAQKSRFGSEFFPAQLLERASGKTFLDFFQVDKEAGGPKGIIVLLLDDG
jgi:hypothetical protein